MKILPLSLLVPLLAQLSTTCGSALVPTEWPYRQSLHVPAPGLVKIVLPAETFDSARPTLADLRLLDPAGHEVPYLLDRGLSSQGMGSGRNLSPKSFRVSETSDTTQLLVESGTTDPLDAIDLETSLPLFLKAAHVEISSDGQEWQSLGPATPVFRQFGAEQLRLSLDQRTAAFLRVTLANDRSRKVDFSGAVLKLSPSKAAPPVLTPLGVEMTRRDEFAGETVLTIGLAGRHVPLAGLTLDAADPLFMRRVTVSVREPRGATSGERTIGSGTIYRVALDGMPARSELDLPLEFSPSSREVIIHIFNGDSPPLTIDAVRAKQHPVSLLFHAATAGDYALLSGNPQAGPPRYDLAAFSSEISEAAAMPLVPGPVQKIPEYRPRESLAEPPMPDVPLTGAPLDTAAWSGLEPIKITTVGVQELELESRALAQSRPDGADLRILHEGRQIPYLLERPALSRSLELTPLLSPDPKRPGVSNWQIRLPEPGLPIQRITLSTTTPLFQRQFRIFEKRMAPDGRTVEIPLASGQWSRKPEPDEPETRTFSLSERPQGDTLWIETDNGDNPAIEPGTARVVYPVVRLIFKVGETEGFTLAYGNKTAPAPQYDLSLVASKLLTSTRSAAQAGGGAKITPAARKPFSELSGGYIFWIALSLVVVALLVVVAKLLPKPPAE